MQTLEAPFAIGQEWWAPIGLPQRVVELCPVCFGQLAVTVTLGNGEQIGVPCEACGTGFDKPQGTIDEWERTPSAKRFVIARVTALWGDRWTVESEDGQSRDFHELCATAAEALKAATEQAAKQHESNMRARCHRRQRVAEATWSIRYHRECIKDLERQVAWHQAKLLTRNMEQVVQQRTSAIAKAEGRS